MGGNSINKFSDGYMKIQDGKGISHAIKTELGLSQTQFNKCAGNIFEIVKEQQEEYKNANAAGTGNGYNLYLKGSDLNGSANENFVVQKDHELKFTQKFWQKILDVVNNALGLLGDEALQHSSKATEGAVVPEDSVVANASTGAAEAPVEEAAEADVPKEVTKIVTQERTIEQEEGAETDAQQKGEFGNLNTHQKLSIERTTFLMNTALLPDNTINKREITTGDGTVTGYIYDGYEEVDESSGEKTVVEVETDIDGKPTKVYVREYPKNPSETDNPRVISATSVTSYNLADGNMTISSGVAGNEKQSVTLPDKQLAEINEKAFLIANNNQIKAAEATLTDIGTAFANGKTPEGGKFARINDKEMAFRLPDTRTVYVILDENNQIKEMQIQEDVNNKDDFANVHLDNEGNASFDRDLESNTTNDRQSMKLSDTSLFKKLKVILQPLVDKKCEE